MTQLTNRQCAERSLIRIILTSPKDLDFSYPFTKLSHEDFEDAFLSDVFLSFEKVYAERGVAGIGTLFSDLVTRQNLVGDRFSHVLEYTGQIQTGWELFDIESLTDMVAEYSERAELSVRLSNLSRDLQDPTKGLNARDAATDVLTIAEKSIEKTSVEENVAPMSEDVSQFFSVLAGDVPPQAPIPSSLPKLNSMLYGGFKPGQLVIIAARPGVGKTTLVLDFVREFIRDRKDKKGCSVFFKSLEMTRQELTDKMFSAEAMVPLDYISDPERVRNPHDPEWERLIQAGDFFRKYGERLIIDDGSENNLMKLVSQVRRLKASNPDLKVVIVDYLQLMTSGTHASRESRQQDVSAISRQLKLLAKENNLVVIALSQLNRESVKNGKTGRPGLADLRESGSIEQDANIVAMIWRYQTEQGQYGEASEPDVEEEVPAIADDPSAWRFRLLIEKSRGSRTGDIKLSPMLHMSTFSQVDSWEELAQQRGEIVNVPMEPIFDEPSEEDLNGFSLVERREQLTAPADYSVW